MSYLQELEEYKNKNHIGLSEKQRWEKLFKYRLFDNPTQVGELSVEGLKKAFVDLDDFKPDTMYQYINLFTAVNATAEDILEIMIPITIKEKHKPFQNMLIYKNALVAIHEPLSFKHLKNFMEKSKITSIDYIQPEEFINIIKHFGITPKDKEDIFEWLVTKLKDSQTYKGNSNFFKDLVDIEHNIIRRCDGLHAKISLNFPNIKHDSLIGSAIDTNDIGSLIYFVKTNEYSVVELLKHIYKNQQLLENEYLGIDLYSLIIHTHGEPLTQLKQEISRILPEITELIANISNKSEPKIADLKILTILQYMDIDTEEAIHNLKDKVIISNPHKLDISYCSFVYSTPKMKEVQKVWIEKEFEKDQHLRDFYRHIQEKEATQLLKECEWLPGKILESIQNLSLPMQSLYTACVDREHPLWPYIIANIANDIKKSNTPSYRINEIFEELFIRDYDSVPEDLNNVDTFIYLITGTSPESFNKTFKLLDLGNDNYITMLAEHIKNCQTSHKNIDIPLPELFFDV